MIPLVKMLPLAVNTAFTLYMMIILLRWAAPYLQLDLYSPRLRWVISLTEPLLRLVRRYVPSVGPFDFSIFAALVAVYILRQIFVALLGGGMAYRG